MVVFKFVHQKPTEGRYVQGNRCWGEIKAELETKYFSNKKKPVDETQPQSQQSRHKKKNEEDNSSFLVAYLQHEVLEKVFRLVHIDEMIPETYSIVVQRLPRKFALANPEVRLANRFISKPDNGGNGQNRPEKRLRENATEDERIDFVLEQSYIDISSHPSKFHTNNEQKKHKIGDEKDSKKFNRTSFSIYCLSADSAKIVQSGENFVQMKSEKKEQKFKRPTGIPKKFLIEIPEEEALVLVNTEPNIFYDGSKYFKMKEGMN